MNISELLEWQWKGYRKAHCSRINLIIHIISVPFFILGTLSLVLSLLSLSLIGVVSSIFTVALAFGAQGFGHSKEKVAAEPFSSPKQALIRIFLEQFFTFPKYVFTGGWYAAFVSNKQKP